MKEGLEREENIIRTRVKQEVAREFHYKIQLSNSKWEDEIEYLKEKAFALHREVKLKDKATLAICQSNMEQESIIINANKLLVQGTSGEVNLEKIL